MFEEEINEKINHVGKIFVFLKIIIIFNCEIDNPRNVFCVIDDGKSICNNPEHSTKSTDKNINLHYFAKVW